MGVAGRGGGRGARVGGGGASGLATAAGAVVSKVKMWNASVVVEHNQKVKNKHARATTQ